MKKIITFCLIAFTMQSTAQDILPVTFGPIVSMTSTSLNSNIDLKDQVAGTGYNVGGFVRIKILLLYTEGELAYSSKSVSATSSSNNINSNVTFKLNGLDASVIVGLKILGLGDIGNLRLFGGYNFNNYSDINYSVNGDTYTAENVNNANSSALAGIGCDVWKLAINLKYLKGLSDLANDQGSEVKTNVVNLSIAYKIK